MRQLLQGLDSFVGRDAEIAQIQTLLSASRLVTLTGPGGVGKTRLALAAVALLRARAPDGVVFVSIASITDPKLVVPVIAQALDIHEIERHALERTLQDALADRELVLVLDNFEQVVDAAPVVASLLTACPRLKILVTSRILLSIRGEQVFQVQPLSLPDVGANRSGVDLITSAAVRLFVERARSARADFTLTDDIAEPVARICQELDGLPLAIELAAAQVRVLSPAALLPRLGRRLPVLVRGPRDVPERHRTLRDAIAWSYELLAAGQRRLFCTLAVFSGGCTLEAAEAVGGAPGEPPTAVLDGVAALIDASLLRQVEASGEPRVNMLQTIREFALEQLAASGEESAARDRHRDWCVALARSEPPWRWTARRLAILEAESANLYAAIQWSIQERQGQIGLQISAGLWPLWLVRGRYAEGRACLKELLSAAGAGEATPARAAALYWAAYLAYRQVDLDAATELVGESLAIARQINHSLAKGRALMLLGNVARERGDFRLAHTQYDRALATIERVEDERWEGPPFVLVQRSIALFEEGDPDQAEHIAAEALRQIRHFDCPLVEGLALQTLGRIAASRGEYATAVSLLEEALALQRGLGDSTGVLWSLRQLGLCELDRGQPDQARHWLAAALILARDTGDRAGVARSLDGLGDALATSDPGRAVRLAAAAAALWQSMDALPNPSERNRLDRWIQVAQRSLGDRAFAAEWSLGQRLRLDQVVAEALRGGVDRAPPPPPAAESPSAEQLLSPLTPRERDVVRLVARGAPAREIAETLVISRGTVRSHIEHVLTKLQLHSRVQLAAWAVQRGFLDP
ncbi:MAG TPA: tetratricopeptide repeat protein [Chloroflexota bacterium]|nr:tetratricopeptide repeat protein [Chloroflexota bacterium]